MKVLTFSLCLAILLAGATQLQAQAIDGVFGLAPVPEGAAMAVWVPLNSGEAVSGIRWYNNDSAKPFPEVLVVAGVSVCPSPLNEAVQVGSDVAGNTLGWSEMVFQQPFASATPGLFLVFKLPPDGAFVTEGDGCGLGYQIGDGQVRCWVATEEGEWSQLSPEYQMAVTPVMNVSKSGDVLVLGTKDENLDTTKEPKVVNRAELQVGPNPFNPRTTIRYSLPKDGDVSLDIFDVRGRKVKTLVTGRQTAGQHIVNWEGRDGRGNPQPSGVYLVQMRSDSIRLTSRITLLK